MEPLLVLRNIKKAYLVDHEPFYALRGIDLEFAPTGFNMILGHSGCGKTTLLNVIGGLDRYDEGELIIEGRSTKEYKDRDYDDYRNKEVGFVFQSYNLIPHLSILDNVSITLSLRGLPSAKRKEMALDALRKVGLEGSEKKKPNQLSGGQMQRVAIARAIAGKPGIILADEPTGALDSKTSVQVMEILKDLSKTCAVIMVTHNRELAGLYGDRLIEMKDGLIVSDKVVRVPEPVTAKAEEEEGKKSRLGFGTAILHSWKNLYSKKGRTITTAVASSIGIIGVALVLSVSNGFSNYVSDIESSVAGSVPVVVSPSVYSYSSNSSGVNFVEYPEDDNVYVYDSSTSSYVAHRNDYGPEYFEYLDKAVKQGLARSVLCNRQNFQYNVLTEDGSSGQYKRVNQYQSAGVTGSLVSGVTSLPTTVFHELYGEESALSDLYSVIYGRFPEAADELVLVTDRYNRIDLSTLRELGIIGGNENAESGQTISFSDLVYDYEGDTSYKAYKAYRTSDFCQVDKGPQTVTTETYVIDSISVGEDYQISYTGHTEQKTFSYYENLYHSELDMADVYSNDAAYNPINLKIVGVLRPISNSIIDLMPASIGHTAALGELLEQDILPGGKGYEVAKLGNENFFMSEERVEAFVQRLNGFISAGNEVDTEDAQDLMNSLYTFVYPFAYRGTEPGATNSPSSYFRFCRMVGGEIDTSHIDIPLDELSNYILGMAMDPGFYNGTADISLFELIAYVNGYSLVTSILVFPESLGTKDALLNYLDAYNEEKEDSDQIVYSDVMSSITDTIALITTVVPAILIVFASISLVVSSVMMAIITYVSVIERTKEIGILRSCGARKKDITGLFESECSLIGVVSGVIGICVSLLLCLPINLILDALFPAYNLGGIASLNYISAIILIALAIVLALISGLIPSLAAAKKDPVVALRSE